MGQSSPGLIPDAAGTEALGAALAAALESVSQRPLVIYLTGELGAGKTTLARGCLRALGHTGTVPSPTYTLVEPYETPIGPLLHIDLYRIRDPGELEFLGLDDALRPGAQASVLLVEWPEQGSGAMPDPHLEIRLAVSGAGRQVQIVPGGGPGTKLARTLVSNNVF